MDGTLAEIRGFAGTFNPKNWVFCHGQLADISQNQALYSLIGTLYGGNGRTTYGIPDLRGRVPIGSGQGPGLSYYRLAQLGGYQQIDLTVNEMPQHSHAAAATVGASVVGGTATATMNVNNSDGENRAPAGNYTGVSGGDIYQDAPSAGSTLNSGAITVDTSGLQVAVGDVAVQVGNTGKGLPFPVIQPYLCIQWIMCVDGLYPQRDN